MDTQDRALLGLATTRELLTEIKARGECEFRDWKEGAVVAALASGMLDMLPDRMLDYSTVNGED